MLLKTINRINSINWGNENVAIVRDIWWNNRNTKTYLFNPSNSKSKPKIISDRNYQDVYSNPGSFVTKILALFFLAHLIIFLSGLNLFGQAIDN